MKPELWQAAIAFIVGGGFASIFRVRARNQLDNANSAVALASAYGKLIDQLEKRISLLETRIELLEKENADLRGFDHGRTAST